MPLTKQPPHSEPPTHRVDGQGIWIHYADPAYARDRVASELEEMSVQMEIARARILEEREEIEAGNHPRKADLLAQQDKNLARLAAIYRTHPIEHYYSGKTRYDLYAEGRIPRAEGEPVIVKAADYFGPDARRFHLRRLKRDIWTEVENEAFSNLAASVRSTGAKMDHQALAELSLVDKVARRKGREKAVLYGLAAVDGMSLPKAEDHLGRPCLAEEALDLLHELDAGLIDLLAKAVLMYSQPLREDEFLLSA